MADQPLSRAQIRPTKEAIEDELLARPGVTGVDINEKVSNGQPTGELAIVVFVEEKKPKSKVTKAQLIPDEIDGVKTDVVEETFELQAFAPVEEFAPQIDAGTYRPVKGGVSMGPCRSFYLEPPAVPTPGNYNFTGTLGAIVKDRSTGKPMALTNFHVAAVDTAWSVGDDMTQPSRVEGGSCPADTFGELTRAVLSERVDGAVVTIDPSIDHSCSIEEIGQVKGKTLATVNMPVRKRGRTTHLTHGTVTSTDVTVTLDYGNGVGVRTLKHQIRIVPDTTQNPTFSQGGDSGSVIVNADNKVIGLLFAGATNGSSTIANPIDDALDELDVDLCVPGFTLVTKPKVCKVVVTKPLVCVLTKPTTCNIVTRTKICQILTSPKVCHIVTNSAVCPDRPPITLACPPVSLACDGGFRPPVDRFGDADGSGLSGDGSVPGDGSGNDSAMTEAVDESFWLGYYTALEAMAEAEDDLDEGA